jgi:CheY-like chemotaxis protein
MKQVESYTNLWEIVRVNGTKPGASILLLEDEAMISEIASEMLSYIGYEVVCAREGSQAVELYNERYHSGSPFSAVIMDLSIPNGMGGEEAVTEVLRIDPQAKVIVSSGYTYDPAMVDFRNFGFSGAIGKPYTIPELDRILTDIIQ